MKKLIALLLALVMVLSLAACGGNPADTTDEKEPSQSQNKTEEEQSKDEQPEDEQPEDEQPEEDASNQEELSFTEQVVIDNEDCTIKITGIDPDNLWGYTLKVFFENKSADKTYTFAADNATINGVQADPFFATEIAPGKKSNEEISFMGDVLGLNDIGDYTDIMVAFGVYDSEDWLADPIAKVTTHVYPYGEDKAVQFVREAQDTDKVLIDNEYVTLIATSSNMEPDWGFIVQLYLVNKTDKDIMFAVEDASVNGFMEDPYYAQTVYAGNCAFGSMEWDESSLEVNGITDVEEIEFTLRAYDEADWEAAEFVNEVIKFNP